MADVSAPGGATASALAPRPLDIDAVLFDLDGTLVDSAPDLAAAANRVRVDRGLAPLPPEQLRPYVSAGVRGLIGVAFARTPQDEGFGELRDAFLAHYAAALCKDTVLFEGVLDLLAGIVARGLKWGIVTNKPARFTEPLVAALELPLAPGAVVCGDTTPHAKPHPAPLLAAAAQLRVRPERCLYVGDAERDVEAGCAAGMPTLVARYGYIHSDEEPEAWPAHGHIEQPSDLLQWLPPR